MHLGREVAAHPSLEVVFELLPAVRRLLAPRHLLGGQHADRRLHFLSLLACLLLLFLSFVSRAGKENSPYWLYSVSNFGLASDGSGC